VTLGAVEIMALIVVILGAVKIITFLIKPSAWMPVVEKAYRWPILTMIVSLVLAVIVLNYLMEAGITIVQIFAVVLFIALLAWVSLASYSKDVVAMGRKVLKDRAFLKKAWVSIVIWVILGALVVNQLFF